MIMKSQITVIMKDDGGKMKETYSHIFQWERQPGFTLEFRNVKLKSSS